MNHRFIIGIGSQRAGSTLLHKLLDVSSNVFMHPVKELHYFDTLCGYRSQEALKDFSLRQMSREVDQILNAKEFNFINNRYRCYLRANNILASRSIDKVDYLDLFRPYLRTCTLLGEVTPEYMLLDDESIARMKSIIGDDAAIILICRNPVRRIISAVKLFNYYNNLRMNDRDANKWLETMLAGKNDWMAAQDGYNDYEGAIDRYSRHFRHFIAIAYDQLTMEPFSVARILSKSLEIRIDELLFRDEAAVVRNDLGGGFSINQKNHEQLTDRYQKSLSFVEQYFGKEIVN